MSSSIVAPRVTIVDAGGPLDTRFAYAITDHEIHSNRPLSVPSAFRIDRQPACTLVPNARAAKALRSVQASGWLAEAHRDLRCDYHSNGASLHVPEIGDFDIDSAAMVIRYAAAAPTRRDGSRLEQVLFGPALIVALAYRSIHFLHASAVQLGESAVAFCAESGVGKSTFAAAEAVAWHPIADDILPVKVAVDGPEALPRFPQLKWPMERQYPLAGAARLPLRSIFVLAPDAPVTTRIELERLSQRESTLALIRHGVASRVFSPLLLHRQMRLCAEIAASVPVVRARYPKRLDALPGLREAILEVARGQVA